jgi:hypothetical protein
VTVMQQLSVAECPNVRNQSIVRAIVT